MTNWHGDELDLDALLARIGYAGERSATPEVLGALHRAYTTTLPFENLEIMLGRPILLDLESLQDKLIRRRRGGYCFEHVTLFAALLEALGFRFTAVMGRVSLGADPTQRPATHALLVVDFDDVGQRLLCDVGFGRGPIEPIPVVDGVEVTQEGWRLRLTAETDAGRGAPTAWTLWQQAETDGVLGWLDRHRWTLNPQYRIDFAVGNHFDSNSPHSPFTMRPFVQRFHADRHDTLDGQTWTTITPDGRVVAQRTVRIEDVPGLLAEVFDVDLDADDAAALMAFVAAT